MRRDVLADLRSLISDLWPFRIPHSEGGWLCPALFRDFETALKELYARVESKVE